MVYKSEFLLGQIVSRPESRTTFPEEDPAFENECYFFDDFAFWGDPFFHLPD